MGAGRTDVRRVQRRRAGDDHEARRGLDPAGPVRVHDLRAATTTTSFTLDDGGTTTLWMPYDTDCSLVETNDGGADACRSPSTARTRHPTAKAKARRRFGPRLHDARSRRRAQRRRGDEHRGHEHRCLGRCLSDEGGQPRNGGPGRARVVHAHRDERRTPTPPKGSCSPTTLPAGLTWSLPEPVVEEPDAEEPDAKPAKAKSSRKKSKQSVEAPTCAIDANTLRCDIGTLEPGGSFTVTVTSNATVRCGIVTNEDATVTSDTPDPNEDNNAAAASVGVTCPPAPAPQNVGTQAGRRDDDDHHLDDHHDDPARDRGDSPASRRRSSCPRRLPRCWRRSSSERLCRRRTCRHRRRSFRRLRLPDATRSAPAPEAPAVVVLRTVNPSATPGGVLGVTGEGCDPNAEGRVHHRRQSRR